MELSLKGKTALVTGGAIGLGAAMAKGLAKVGADVAFTYLRHDKAEVEEALRAFGVNGGGWSLDATNREQVDRVVGEVAESLGGLDILINNAGGMLARARIAEADDDHWQRTIDLNLTSSFYCTRAALPHMRSPGRIVFLTSLAGQNGGSAGQLAYATAKAGLFGLTRALAKEVAHRDITVNAIAPGIILQTPFHETFTPKEEQEQAIGRIALGRAGAPTDVAGAALFLASDLAAFMTGGILDVNGGQWFTA